MATSSQKLIEIAEYYFRSNQYQLAKEILVKLISTKEANSKCFELLAYIFGNEGNQKEALRHLNIACSYVNASAESHYYHGKELIKIKQFEDAINHLTLSIKIGGEFFEGLFELGLAHANLKNGKNAEIFFKKALSLKPENIEALFNLAKLNSEVMNNIESSIRLYIFILSKEPNHSPSLFGLAECYENLNRLNESIFYYKQAIKSSPFSDDFWQSYLHALNKSGQIDEAYETLNQIRKEYKKQDSLPLIEGIIDLFKGRFKEAILVFNKVITSDDQNFKAWFCKALAEFNLGNKESSLTSIEEAIYFKNDYALAWFYKGNILTDKGFLIEGFECYAKALDFDPKIPLLKNNFINTKLSLLDWNGIDSSINKIFESVRDYLDPLTLLYICDEPNIILENNFRWTRNRFRKFSDNYITPLTKSSKIKIAYISSDFRDHAVMHLSRDLFKKHNRNKFEIFAFFTNCKESDYVTSEIKAYFDHFIDITNLDDHQAIKLIRTYEIDIAIDLNGHTKHARTNIFLNRIAKSQVNFIGYPNTMGNSEYDFIVADEVLIANDDLKYYSEKIIYISPCFQPNSIRKYNRKFFDRSEFNLPDGAFIFCCFNLNLKISNQILNSWIRVLNQTVNTVLWVYIEKFARENFIKAITSAGISLDRIIFTERLSYDVYMSRFYLADLFLDTYPFGGGTTFSDALLSELPVLTLAGNSFHSRMGKSLLYSLKIPELVSESFDEYTEKAILFSKNKFMYSQIKEKLKNALDNKSLFDSSEYTQHFEHALLNAHYSKHKSGTS
jgi:predicted O-linked N-acetylglucosamine transferase (SPINDLY family)